MIELVIRLVFSLSVVVGLLLLLAKFAGKRFQGRSDAAVRVLHRQSLSRSSSVAIVTVGSRILVLGTTEQQVQLLTELDPDDLDADDPALGLDLGLDPTLGLDPSFTPVYSPALPPAQDRAQEAHASPDLDLDLDRLIEDALRNDPDAPWAHEVETTSPVVRRSAPRWRRAPRSPRPPRAGRGNAPAPQEGALAGSVLSPLTWKQAMSAASGKDWTAS